VQYYDLLDHDRQLREGYPSLSEKIQRVPVIQFQPTEEDILALDFIAELQAKR
jgi:hypothetical protein